MVKLSPKSTDKLNSPSHSLLHRVITVDSGSSQSTIDVDGNDNVGVGTTSQTSKLHIAGPVATAITTKTNDYTVLASDSTILADGTSNTVTITLPTAVGIEGRIYVIKCIDDTFTVDVDPDGTEEIDGDNANFALIQDESITIQSNNVGWYIT